MDWTALMEIFREVVSTLGTIAHKAASHFMWAGVFGAGALRASARQTDRARGHCGRCGTLVHRRFEDGQPLCARCGARMTG